MPVVSIIIVCMNRPDNLRPCLQSIKKNTSAEYEVLAVAYRFDADNLSELRAEFPWVRFIVNNGISGFSENNNLALRQAAGDYCFVLNDDTELPGPTIDALLADFGRLPEDAAIVAPKLLNADGSLCWREPTDNGRGLFRTFNISGAAFLIKTSIFRELGWFDERYFFTPEDIALSTLARERGYTVWCDSEAAVVHKWRTTASRISTAVRPAAVRGSLIFFSRGSSLRYLLLALGVWPAEMAKRIKARLLGRYSDYLTYRNITRSIFTWRSPKELFVRFFNEL